ncbi:stimulated by retinoic acid 6 protein, partial [Biomphalaria pfeifferi]
MNDKIKLAKPGFEINLKYLILVGKQRITVELAAYFYKLFGNIHQMVVQDLDIIGWEEKPGDGSIINADRRALRFGYYATRTIRFSLMVALVLACTLSFFTILHMMSSFR